MKQKRARAASERRERWRELEGFPAIGLLVWLVDGAPAGGRAEDLGRVALKLTAAARGQLPL